MRSAVLSATHATLRRRRGTVSDTFPVFFQGTNDVVAECLCRHVTMTALTQHHGSVVGHGEGRTSCPGIGAAGAAGGPCQRHRRCRHVEGASHPRADLTHRGIARIKRTTAYVRLS
jgi:hypothetical protein